MQTTTPTQQISSLSLRPIQSLAKCQSAKRLGALLTGAMLLLQTSNSLASGFALIEHSASGQGNAFAGGAAEANDASTAYFNPAGMVLFDHTQFVIAGHSINPTAKFVDQGSHLSTSFGQQPLEGDGTQDGGVQAIVPNFYALHPINDKLTFGFAFNVPFGLSVKYDDTWIGRYHAVESELRTLNINPSLAYKFSSSLSLGFGISLQPASVKLSSAVDFAALFTPQGGTRVPNDGFAVITGDNSNDLALGWNLGLLVKLDADTRFGMAYRSSIHQQLTGDVDFTVPGQYAATLNAGGTFNDGAVSADVTFPSSLSISAYHRYSKSLSLVADITWTGWSEFDELRVVYDKTDNPNQPDSVTTEDWRDSYRYALGLNYVPAPGWVMRWGVALDKTPVPSPERRTPRIPDNDRTWMSFGMSHQITKRLTVDLAFSRLQVKDTQIDNTIESTNPALRSNITGNYTGSVDIFSAQVTWNMD